MINNYRSSLTSLTLVLVALSLTIGGFAPIAAAQQDPCEADRQKYCPTYRADDPRRLYCLKSIESQIKPACKGSLRDVTGTEEDFIDQCTEDYDKFCKEVPVGKGRILKCLKSHTRELSFECRKKVGVFPNPK